MVASSAATQITPGAMVRSTTGSGPRPSGKRLTTMTKKTSGVSMSVLRRMATVRSRQNRRVMAFNNFSTLVDPDLQYGFCFDVDILMRRDDDQTPLGEVFHQNGRHQGYRIHVEPAQGLIQN